MTKQLTSELQASELEGDEPIANFNKVHKGIEVVWCQDKAVPRAVGAPAAQQQVSTQRMLQWAGQVLIKDRVQVVVISTFMWRKKKKRQ